MSPATWPRDDPLARAAARTSIRARAASRDAARRATCPRCSTPAICSSSTTRATLPASLRGARADGSPVEAAPRGRARGRRAARGALRRRRLARRAPRTAPRPPPRRRRRRDSHFGHGLDAAVVRVSTRRRRASSPHASRARRRALGRALPRRPRRCSTRTSRAPLQLWAPQTRVRVAPVGRGDADRRAGRSRGAPARRAAARRALRAAHARGRALVDGRRRARCRAAAAASATRSPRRRRRAVAATPPRGGRVIAVGTTVVRALEGCAVERGRRARAGAGATGLRIGRGVRARASSTGSSRACTSPTASHFALLHAFAPGALLRARTRTPRRAGYLGHEFGDSTLLLAA